jgi:hypothetical protein
MICAVKEFEMVTASKYMLAVTCYVNTKCHQLTPIITIK